MRWKQCKTDPNLAVIKLKKTPFLVLPKIDSPPSKSMSPKNPGLRLFTKTWEKRSQNDTNENGRPLTATLEKPQVLDVDLAAKIDMSLVRKEFLCIANLCRVPLGTLTAKAGPKIITGAACQNNRRRRPPVRPLSLPGGNKVVQLKKTNRPCTSEDSWEENRSSLSRNCNILNTKNTACSKMHKIKSPKTPTSNMTSSKQTRIVENDANNNTNHTNNGFKTYRVTKKNRVVHIAALHKPATKPDNKLPQPCKTCGRLDQPERFHSHPDVPSSQQAKKPVERVTITKNIVQKPVAIKYKSKLTQNQPERAASRAMKNNQQAIPKKVTSARGPRTLTCFICGREFGTTSLHLHEPKCLERWDRENAELPTHLQRKRPVKPDHALTKEEWNTYAWESSQANLVPCQNCKRTFYPDRLLVHQRSCKPKEVVTNVTMAKLPKQEQETITPPAASPKPRSVPCPICGRLFGTKSIKIHEPQCLKKWHMHNDHLPPSEREPKYQDTIRETPAPPQSSNATSAPESTSSTTSANKKPPMFPCYLCGRLFSVNSIYIHEPQCLKKWRAENDKLPPHKRRPEPLKPDVKFTPSGGVDFVGTFHRIWDNHLAELIACKKCGRRFFPGRIEKHEGVCTGLGFETKNKKQNK